MSPNKKLSLQSRGREAVFPWERRLSKEGGERERDQMAEMLGC